jgi:hypothetical protein
MSHSGSIQTMPTWKPGTDLPFVIRFGEAGMLAILLRVARAI